MAHPVQCWRPPEMFNSCFSLNLDFQMRLHYHQTHLSIVPSEFVLPERSSKVCHEQCLRIRWGKTNLSFGLRAREESHGKDLGETFGKLGLKRSTLALENMTGIKIIRFEKLNLVSKCYQKDVQRFKTKRMSCTVLYCAVLCCTAVRCTALHCIV